MSKELIEVIDWLTGQATDSMGMEPGDRARMAEAALFLQEMKDAMHEVDKYCNTVRVNYRSGSREEIIASTVKVTIRPFLR